MKDQIFEKYLNEGTNYYFKVLKPITVWKHTGYSPSNTYAGTARIHAPTYEEVQLKPGDEIQNLISGTYGIFSGNPTIIRIVPPEDINPGGLSNTNRKYSISEYLKDRKIKRIDRSEAIEIFKPKAH